MVFLNFSSWARILISTILLFLFPTALRFTTIITSPTSPTPSGTLFRDKTVTRLPPPPQKPERRNEQQAQVTNASFVPTQPPQKPERRNEQQPQVTNASFVPTQRKKARAASVVEEGLARARWAIRRAARKSNASALSYEEIPLPRLYRNPSAFYQSYIEMERRLKVYVYEEGEPPLVHDGPSKSIYTTEGRFIHEMEMMKGGLRTKDPHRAQVFFLPFSVARMAQYIYKAGRQYLDDPLKPFVSDYIQVISSKHPYWNRTAGTDHFMLACHDWGPTTSAANTELYNNAIRALCNANTSEGFRPRKDVSIPEIHLQTGDIAPVLLNPIPPHSPRPYLAFFAGGGLHGPIRPILLREWGAGRDPDMQVHQYLPKGVDYYKDYMLRSRFCLCPSGYEVASPRLVEAIYTECVPVLMKKGYSAPFSDVLRYEEFAITVEVDDIPRLKEILSAVSDEEVERLKEGGRAVRRHFVFNRPPKRFDVFHMILHSVWLRRLNVKMN